MVPHVRKPHSGVTQVLWSVVGALVLTAAILLIAGPGRGLRSDIDRQKDLITQQLRLTKQQLTITKQQLELTKQQLAMTRQQLDISSKTLDIAEKQLDIAQQQLSRTDITIDMQRKLLAIAQQTLEQAREINRKTVDLTPGNKAKAQL